MWFGIFDFDGGFYGNSDFCIDDWIWSHRSSVDHCFLFPYRHWLGFMLAGMLFWGILEAIRYGIQNALDLSLTYSYLSAISLAMIGLTAFLLGADSRAQKALARRQYIEHTPVYEDE